jgi:hypothetical protein
MNLCRAVAQLPGLNDPGSTECDDSSPPDVDVAEKQASEIDRTCNGIATYVLRYGGECEAGGEKEHPALTLDEPLPLAIMNISNSGRFQ